MDQSCSTSFTVDQSPVEVFAGDSLRRLITTGKGQPIRKEAAATGSPR